MLLLAFEGGAGSCGGEMLAKTWHLLMKSCSEACASKYRAAP